MSPKSIVLSVAVVLSAILISILSQAYQTYKNIGDTVVTSWSTDHRADCGVVLTGGPNRIGDAVEQLYLGRIKKVIISGVNPAVELADIFPQKTFYGTLNSEDIILEKRSLTTYGNAQQALLLVQALNCKDVVLITSRTHMHRAFKTFRSHFPKEIPIYQRATVGRRLKPHWFRLFTEVCKALFYDFWFY